MKKFFTYLIVLSVALIQPALFAQTDWKLLKSTYGNEQMLDTLFNIKKIVVKENKAFVATAWGLGAIKDDNVEWFNWNNTGLTNKNTWAMADMCADKSNNLWCATVNGLIKYDGNQFTLLTNTNSGLLTNSFTGITCDKNNNVWCTDRGKYIYKIKDATVEVFDVTQINIPFPYIQGSWIQEDPLGNIWYSSGKLLTHYDGEKWIVSDTNFVPLNQTNSQVIVDFYITRNNDYVVATDKQAILLYRNGSWYQYTHENIAALPEYEPGIGSIYTITEDKDGNILIGIAWWKPDNNPKILVLDKNIETNSQWSTIDLPPIGTTSENPYSYGPKAIVIDDDNKLWVGTNMEGVLVYNHYPPASAVENEIENTLSILPNPANDYITIALKPSEGFDPSEGSAIYIYNTLGEKVLSVGTGRDLSVRINITVLPKGVYFVKAGNNTCKFVKM